MKNPDDEKETICAIATPHGEGSIGIVRISGPRTFKISAPLYRGPKPIQNMASHTAYFGEVVNPIDNSLIDQALFLPMHGPNSYTGEDILEIQAHGNPFLLQKIVSALISQGARMARPGEFTQRAFLSGKMDLSQAEAVMELISAKSTSQHQWALDQLKGRLSIKIETLKKRLLAIIAEIEASIDFSDQDIPVQSGKEIVTEIQQIKDEIHEMISNYDLGRQIIEGFTVVIAGRPNVGKSSLMNYFLQEDRAIVTPEAGTTRDLLQEPLQLEGLSVKLIDTAGFRNSHHPIEQEGIRRAQKAQERSDLTLWVLDISEKPSTEDHDMAKKLQPEKTIILLNKSDLPKQGDIDNFIQKHPQFKYTSTSLVSEEGLAQLKIYIKSNLIKQPEKEQPLVALLRHKIALETAEEKLLSGIKSSQNGDSFEFPAIDLREAIDALGQITGETTLDDIFDQIFNQFCIGK